MKHSVKKSLLFGFSIFFVVFCLCGCTTSSNVTFNWDGTFDYSVTTGASYEKMQETASGSVGQIDVQQIKDGINQYIEEWETELEKYDGITVETIEEDGYSGLKFSGNYSSAQKLDESGLAEFIYDNNQYAPTVGGTKNANIQMLSVDHVFYKSYQLIGEIPNFAAVASENSGNGGFLLPYEAEFSATVPLKFATRAKGATEEGNTYIWRTDSEKGACEVSFITYVPTVWGFVLVGGILLLLILIIAILIIRTKKRKKNARIAASIEEENAEEKLSFADRVFYQEDDADTETKEENASNEE